MSARTRPVPSWRGDAPTPQPPDADLPLWRREALPAAPRRRFPWKITSVLLIGLFGSAAALVWVALWLQPPEPARLVLVGAGYEENLAVPANVYGREAMKTLAAESNRGGASWFRRDGRLRAGEPVELHRGTTWDAGLTSAREKTVVLFLALHGGADPQGAYLLPHDADPADEPGNRLRLEAVLERLEKLPASKNKVLILDATQAGANWPFGMLHNDFARALERLEPRIAAVPNLIVLSSSAADQRSWVSDEWRASAFTHYLIEGIRGGADADRNGRLSAWELAEFVRPRVEAWARDNRGALQTPVLLPRGPEGERRAQSIHLAMTERNYKLPDPTATPSFALPPEWQQAWDEYRRLASLSPPPATYAPHKWREYQAALLRYEELLRAGDSASANRLLNRLRALGSQVEQARFLDLRTASQTLAMPVAAGSPRAAADPRYANWIDDLAHAPAAERGKRWAALQRELPADRQERLRARLKLCEALVLRAAADPAKNLADVEPLLPLLTEGLGGRPAEVHFLAMLHRLLPPTPLPRSNGQLLQLALNVRLQAERAALAASADGYPYSELVAPWLRESVEKADRLRRPGEDLLFATDGKSWDGSRERLSLAEVTYRETGTTADALREAVALRDRVLTELPAYSRWLAQRRRPAGFTEQVEDANLLQAVVKLWDDAHRLAVLLAGPPDPANAEVFAAELRKQTAAIDKPFRDLQERHAAWLREAVRAGESCGDQGADTPGESVAFWQDAEAALAVPHLDSPLRKRLLTEQRRVSRVLLIESVLRPGRLSAVSPERTREIAYNYAQRQGRMALAVLGTDNFKELLPDADGRAYSDTLYRLDRFPAEAEGWQLLAQAGDAVGRSWRALPAEVNRLTAVARTSAGKPDAAKGERADLAKADRLARLLDGTRNRLLRDDPPDAFRRYAVQGLLMEQARRALADHWYSEFPDGPPYYETAGLAFLNDALTVRGKTPPPAGFADLRTHVETRTPFPMAAAAGRRVTITDQQRFNLEFLLSPAAVRAGQPGFPVFWLDAGERFRPDPKADPAALRQVRELSPEVNTVAPIAYALRNPYADGPGAMQVPRREVAKVQLRGLFRGRVVPLETEIDLYPLPEVATYHRPIPELASVAVRTSPEVQRRYGEGNGAVSFVIDCSGSMGKNPDTPKARSKFEDVADALELVLRELPRGTRVTVWTFGQAINGRKSVDDAEETIRPLLPEALKWNPADAQQLAGVMQRVRALEPWNESPVVRAVLEARKELLADAPPGFKTVVLLTDGMDNRWEKDRAYNRAKVPVQAALREAFTDSGVTLNVIGFRMARGEAAHARDQFLVVRQFRPAGEFYDVTEGERLADALRAAVRQRIRFQIARDDPFRPLEFPGVELAASAAGADQWLPRGVSAGGYQLRADADRVVTQNVSFAPGDRLLARLAAARGGLRFERVFYLEEDFPAKPWREQSGWRLAGVQNQFLAPRRLQMLVMLEPKPADTPLLFLQEERPRETWLELTAPSADAAFAVRWGAEWGYPASAWGLDVPQWPGRVGGGSLRPVVRAWWHPAKEMPSYPIVRDKLPDRSFLKLSNLPCQLGPDEILLESVSVETHRVEVKPGVREERACLAVRIAHAKDRPFRVLPEGLLFTGQEQRFYTQANRTTALFWRNNLPLTPEDVEAMTALRLESVAEFKKLAQEGGYARDLDNLAEPRTDDERPKPPLPLK